MNTTKKLKREARRLPKYIRNAENHVRDHEKLWLQTQNEKPGIQSELDVLGDLQHARKILRDYKERYNDVREFLVLRAMTPEERFYRMCLGVVSLFRPRAQ